MNYSKRMQTFSLDEQYLSNEGDLHFPMLLQDELEVNFSVSLSRNGLEKINYRPDPEKSNDVRIAIFFALSKLLAKSNLERLKNFSARELESFLRDENHVACMENFPIQFISEFKEKLTSELFYYQVSQEVDGWNISKDATYVEKITALSDFLAIKVNTHEVVSSENIELHLVHLTNEQAFIELRGAGNGLKMDGSLLSKALLDKLQLIMRRIIESESIILVAE